MIGKLTITDTTRNEKFHFITNGYSCNGERKKSEFIVDDGNKMSVKRSWFKSSYEMIFSNGKTAHLKPIGGFKENYECSYLDKNYFLYVHKGLNISIFNDKFQIGFIKKPKKIFKNSYDLEFSANDDVNGPLLLFFCLVVYYNQSKSSEQSSVTFDFGNIGPEEFAFNESWKPRSISELNI
jgi:hypothetical protein